MGEYELRELVTEWRQAGARWVAHTGDEFAQGMGRAYQACADELNLYLDMRGDNEQA